MNILFVACEWKERSVKRFSGGAATFKGFYTDAYFLGETRFLGAYYMPHFNAAVVQFYILVFILGS